MGDAERPNSEVYACATSSAVRLLTRLYPGILDDLRPLGRIRLDDSGELVGRIADAVETELREPLARVRKCGDLRCPLVAVASNPNQESASKSAIPDSAMVGRSGVLGERLSEVMAIPRSWPPRTVGRIAPMFCSVIDTRPPITSVKIAPR